ncbi:MAG TPA: hypothetical protein VHW95_01685 [Steroidobacteraceae bacterium]|jgi:putative effector of murein hydrolase LrgA (UPF0299 family)|nr:hypothetical protein [Steroidobacteraceae bacterium]
MGHFHYARHFGVLGAATVVLFLLGHWNLLADSLVGSFAINGALHAGALALTLRSPQSLLRKACFIVLAAALSVFTMYVGIVGLVLFAAVPGNARLYLVLGLCSLTGALTYGSLVRMFWIRRFSARLILAMAFLCLPAASLGFFARTYSDFLGGWWLAAVWWFAFSGALCFFDTHPNALSRPKYNKT